MARPDKKGRAALEKLYQKVFAGRKGSKLAITIISLRQVGTDVAIESAD